MALELRAFLAILHAMAAQAIYATLVSIHGLQKWQMEAFVCAEQVQRGRNVGFATLVVTPVHHVTILKSVTDA